MDIRYKTFFYFVKHKDKESRTILKKKRIKKIAHTELSCENLSMAKNTTCYAHIDWLLIKSTVNVVQSNILSHNAVQVNISAK